MNHTTKPPSLTPLPPLLDLRPIDLGCLQRERLWWKRRSSEDVTPCHLTDVSDTLWTVQRMVHVASAQDVLGSLPPQGKGDDLLARPTHLMTSVVPHLTVVSNVLTPTRGPHRESPLSVRPDVPGGTQEPIPDSNLTPKRKETGLGGRVEHLLKSSRLEVTRRVRRKTRRGTHLVSPETYVHYPLG